MNDFVILSDFPQDVKAIGPAFHGNAYYSFKKESYFTFHDLLDDDDLREGIYINQDSDRDCTIGIPLFVVSRVNDEGKLVKCDENTFFQSVLGGNSGLEEYIMIDPQSIIEKLSTLKELATEELRRSANAYDCDAFWPTHILYSFDEDSKTIGYEISGSGYVINSAPNFEKNPELIKLI